MEPTAFYSSTSGTYFPDEAALKEHYQSDLHRYNLKRKVAGLPPVTKEWFNSRKEQLTLSGSTAEVQKACILFASTSLQVAARHGQGSAHIIPQICSSCIHCTVHNSQRCHP